MVAQMVGADVTARAMPELQRRKFAEEGYERLARHSKRDYRVSRSEPRSRSKSDNTGTPNAVAKMSGPPR